MSRPGALVGVAAAVLGLLMGVVPGTAAALTGSPTPPDPPGRAVAVSFTFDDGIADQMGYLDILARHGLVGTFYVNTGSVGQPTYFTRAELGRIAAAGDEIGGHTVSHAQLTADAPDETARQICDDRATLTSWGFDPVSFAYPFGAYDLAVEATVRACGYTSARRVGGLGVEGPACPGCVSGEDVAPADPYAVRTAAQVTSSTTLADLEQSVLAARAGGGGWVPLIFHHESCDTGCGDLSSDPALLDAFASWLVGQQQTGAVVVRTVGQVIARPGGPPRPAPAATSTAVTNGDLRVGSGTLPDCWQTGGFGINTANYRWAPAAGGQPASETVTVSAYTSGDATMLPRLDLGQCTPATSPGLATALAARYRSSVPTQFAVYRRNGVGSWQYWTSSPWLPPAPDWTPATWTTPPAPPDTTGVAAGLTVGAVGGVTSTAYAVTPVAVAVAAPPPVWLGGRGLLMLGAVAAAALGLLGAVIGLLHHQRRRGRHRRVDEAWGPAARVPAPRPDQHEQGKHEHGKHNQGKHEHGKHEHGKHERGNAGPAESADQITVGATRAVAAERGGGP